MRRSKKRNKPKEEPRPERTSAIRFSADKTGEGYSFKAGQTYTLPLASCQRWVRRGVADYVDSGPVEAAVVDKTPQPVEPPAPKPVVDLITDDDLGDATPTEKTEGDDDATQ